MLTELEKNAIRDHYRAIADNLPHFRPRAAQREMIAAIANTFARSLPQQADEEAPSREGESIAVIEGPTGVGKSLAYLLAGGIMAQTLGKRLIVSSATIALQEQLVHRDLPFVIEKSGLELTFALAKGRGRYLCPYKLYQLTQSHAQNQLGFEELPTVLWDSKPSAEDLAVLRELADQFAARQFNGDRDTWQDNIADTLWLKVTNDRHSCLKNTCPNRAECPFYLAREALENVDVVVAKSRRRPYKCLPTISHDSPLPHQHSLRLHALSKRDIPYDWGKRFLNNRGGRWLLSAIRYRQCYLAKYRGRH